MQGNHVSGSSAPATRSSVAADGAGAGCSNPRMVTKTRSCSKPKTSFEGLRCVQAWLQEKPLSLRLTLLA